LRSLSITNNWSKVCLKFCWKFVVEKAEQNNFSKETFFDDEVDDPRSDFLAGGNIANSLAGQLFTPTLAMASFDIIDVGPPLNAD
jgi:hypothetical protein